MKYFNINLMLTFRHKELFDDEVKTVSKLNKKKIEVRYFVLFCFPRKLSEKKIQID